MVNNKLNEQCTIHSVVDAGDEYKTVEHITRESIESAHVALRGITGENPESFERRLQILHAISTKAQKPRLKLEDISRISHLPIQDITGHLRALKEGGLLDNKGGQYWRLTPKGRRLVDNLTILLFEHSGDFDEMDLIRASLTHLSELAKEYGLDLKVESRILRFFDDILAELEDQAIELLDPAAAKKVRQTLKKAESFYNHLRGLLYKHPDILAADTWILLDRLAKRHCVVGQLMDMLNEHISKLGAHIDIQEALSYYLDNLTPKQSARTCESFSRFCILHAQPKIPIDNLLKQVRRILSQEQPPTLPDFDTFPIQETGEGLIEEDDEKALENLLAEIEARSEQGSVWIYDLIDADNWELSAPILILLSRLSAEGWVTLSNDKDEDLDGKGIKRIRNAEVKIHA